MNLEYIKSLYFKYRLSVSSGTVLIGAVLWLVGLHFNVHLVQAVGETITLVFALHFTYELFIREDERKFLIDSLNTQLNKHFDSINSQLTPLSHQLTSFINIQYFSDSKTFYLHWAEILSHYPYIDIIGIGDASLKYIHGITDDPLFTNKVVKIYVSASSNCWDTIIKLLKYSISSDNSMLNIYHIDRIDWGFILAGYNADKSSVALLFNVLDTSADNQSGYYVTGYAAIEILTSLNTRFTSTSEGHCGAVRILNEETLGFIIKHNTQHNHTLRDLSFGIPLTGEKEICERMSDILRKSTRTLKVTHCAEGVKNIQIFQERYFDEWINVNYEARNRTPPVDIIRIIIAPEKDLSDPNLIQFMDNMKNHNIHIRFCKKEKLNRYFYEDFSIYDNKDLVYIDNSRGGPWIGGAETAGRHTTDRSTISKYNEIWNVIYLESREWEGSTRTGGQNFSIHSREPSI